MCAEVFRADAESKTSDRQHVGDWTESKIYIQTTGDARDGLAVGVPLAIDIARQLETYGPAPYLTVNVDS